MKKIKIILGAIFAILFVGLLFGGNYFYGEAVKRGVDVELHREATSVNADASPEDHAILEEAKNWFNNRDKEILTITSYDGLKLKAQFIKNEAENKKVVLLAHGYRNVGNDMGKYAKMYYDEGFDILIPDHRGHGESEGDYIGYGWHDRFDFLRWIDEMIKRGTESVILHGNSMGAALVLMTSGEELPDEVKGIIADSSYTTVKEELKHQLKHLYGLPSFPILDVTSMITKIRAGYFFGEGSAIDQVKKNTRPLLLIHGDADDLVPTWMGEALYEAAGGEKELWMPENVGHTKAFDVYTKEFIERVMDFVNRVIEN
ncbi:alpha/beta hydrolase [Fervidibacillus halotolerans]|uniref:Alpha/beta hydrolase n=1 Tax=Fervidibacillus halotolerans TaxID=2980027 RepID=A0A9E8RYC7_9BACI|nr:alpha/beta hydrolase [Fervidibacillus halotolerans]WAA12706.1 alpha/beta hydrolase [Fervidibacillus halotolerans]